MPFPTVSVLFGIASALYILIDFQLIRGLGKLKSKNKPVLSEKPSITVLIAARNEENNLPRVLNALLTQDYPVEKIQIVVVNDRSEDGTPSILRSYSEENPGMVEYVNVSSVPSGMSPKKHALQKGLEIARGEWVAVTDADCLMKPNWLSTLSREFTKETGMVLGFTGYKESKNGFGIGLGAQALEFASYSVVSAGLIGLGFPVIANANNLAYRRKAYDEALALNRHLHIVSGDDDFVVQAIHATGKWVVKYCSEPDALMFTQPPESWSHFWEQRKRWASKCAMYGAKQVAFLTVIFAFYTAIPILLLMGFRDAQWACLGLMVFAVKTLADLVVMRTGLNIFHLSKLLRFFPWTALLHIPLIVAAVIAGTLGGFTWKGQKLSSRA